MKKIVISSDYNRLAGFLDNQKEEYFYIVINCESIDVAVLLKEKGCKECDIHEGLNEIDFSKEYIDFIGRLNRSYHSIYWWANSISYKGTFVSDLGQEIFNYYGVVSLLKKYKRNYIIVSGNAVLNSSIKKYCDRNRIDCKLMDGKSYMSCVTYFKRRCVNTAYFLYNGWVRKIWVFVFLSKRIKKSLKNKKSYYVLRSWIEKRSFLADGSYRDLFFGSLPDYLKTRGVEFIILTGILTDYKKMISEIRHVKEFLIIPQEYFIEYLDYIKAVIAGIVNRPKIKESVKFCGLEVTDLLKECLKKDYEQNEIGKNLLYYYYMKTLLKKIEASAFAFPFENQAWERMTIAALRKYSPRTKIIGYAHVAISQSWLGYFYSKEEEDVILLPDRLLTIGNEPRLILCSTGNYIDKLELSDSCALRYEYLFKKDKITRNKNGKILAAFSIDVKYSLKLLQFLRSALSDKDKYQVILRSHPVTPVETIISKYGITLNSNFRISKNLTFEQDLKDANMLIYVDTTSSAEALMCGIPAINVDFKEPANPDPLFKLNNLKWTASSGKELRDRIDYIYGMGDDEYLEKYNRAMLYLKRYFYPVEEKYLEEFIRR